MPRTVSISRTYGPNALGRLGQALQVGGQTVNDVFQKINDFRMNDELAKYLSSSESPDVAPVWNPANYTLGGGATADVIEGPPKEPMMAQANEPKAVTKGRKAAFDAVSSAAQPDVNPLLASEGTAQIPKASQYSLAEKPSPGGSSPDVSPFMKKIQYDMASSHLRQQMGDEEYNKELQKVQGVVQILMKYGHSDQALPFMLKHLEMLSRDRGYDTRLLQEIYRQQMMGGRQERGIEAGTEREKLRGENQRQLAAMNNAARERLAKLRAAQASALHDKNSRNSFLKSALSSVNAAQANVERLQSSGMYESNAPEIQDAKDILREMQDLYENVKNQEVPEGETPPPEKKPMTAEEAKRKLGIE